METSAMGFDRLPLTLRGKAMLEEELKKAIHIERPAAIRAIEEARSHGDLSENAEYDAAKEHQGLLEGRISEIQGALAGAEVVDTSQIKSDRIVFGAHVSLLDVDTEEKVAYQIVGVDEADVKEGRISILSPLARALIGKVKGDVVQVKSPKTEKEFEILEFHFK
jgi:transcription elongation factor GreA